MPRKTGLLVLLIGCALSVMGSAGRIVQELSPAQSKVHFSMTSPLLELSGKFNRYTGTLELDPSLQPAKVSIRLDASEVNLAPVSNFGNFNPEALFRTLPNPIVTFSSTSIKPAGANKFRVDGIVRRGGKQWPAHFNATMVKRTSQVSEFYFTTSGPVLDLTEQLPFQTGGMNEEGSVECRLVFVRAK